MLTPSLRHHPSRRRWTADAAATATGLNAHAAGARATLTLGLSAWGLIDVVDSLGRAERWLVQASLLALLALAFFIAARRSPAMRFAWLLSGSVATGLAVAASYNLVQVAVTPAIPAVGAVMFAAIALLVVHTDRRRSHPRG
jgi:FtsH-binding integral membrane protein